MTLDEDYAAFSALYDSGRAGVRLVTLVADLETPVSAYLKLAAGRAGNMFLLESVEGGAQRGRYSMIGLDPDLVWRSSGAAIRDQPPRRWSIPEAFVALPRQAPLEALRALLAESAHRAAAPACRRCRRACSAISATTWCATWSASPRPSPIRSACPRRC